MKLDRICMFKRTKSGDIIQCVIKPVQRRAFEDEGFVDDVESLPEKRKRRSKQEIEQDGE